MPVSITLGYRKFEYRGRDFNNSLLMISGYYRVTAIILPWRELALPSSYILFSLILWKVRRLKLKYRQAARLLNVIIKI